MIDDLQQECTQTLPDTQILASQKLDLSQSLEYGWGSLIPISEGDLSMAVLTEECYTVGRSPACDICLNRNKVDHTHLGKISKVHFKIMCSVVDSNASVIYIEDLSTNGTYVNGKNVGKNKKVILSSSDEIALAIPSFKVFIFLDARRNADQWLPEELSTNFCIVRHLGSGGFGDVKLVINKKTFQINAMKKVENNREREKVIFNEVTILKRLQHPFIIRFEAIYETFEAVFITLEYMSGGNLLQRLQNKKRISERECKLIFFQLTLGVKYLHDEGVVHRDLKPENILLELKGETDVTVKITDFGLSKLLHSATNLRTQCGTLRYTAPEVIKLAEGKYSPKVDIWSLGVILFFCLSGEPPFFTCATVTELANSILRGAYILIQSRWQLISKSAVKLVKHMLKVNPDERISSSDLVLHVWFEDDRLKSKVQQLFGDKLVHFNDSLSNLSDLQDFCIETKRFRTE